MSIEWKKKLSSRKFWAAVANFIVNVVTFCLCPSGSPERITALVLSFGGFVAYIVAEGMVDAANKPAATQAEPDGAIEFTAEPDRAIGFTAEPEFDTRGEGL